MKGQTVLLRLVDGPREGWQWMEFAEFLRIIRLDEWNSHQFLVGMVLPPVRGGNLHPEGWSVVVN